ncbi:diadenylate cyclase [Candidatus Similichlamydia laticola]|uniref:Diadenylate cyclase n=1 Tax=Candidatus Similichlamydia laticola TaxID=2170265 RepID=A0A369KCW8_9BACT|nr:diadenylate cyclase [Candidatus Similichlamydia laticola]RDB31748.1 Diadenylate cyclase/bacterial checkpoint controller DisA [Candidatus Similichlamydia laticola]
MPWIVLLPSDWAVRLLSVCEISISALIIDYFLSFFWATRVMNALLLLSVLWCASTCTHHLDLTALSQVTWAAFSICLLAVPSLFQPELRIALVTFGSKKRKDLDLEELESFLDQLTQSVFRMANHRVGGLIIIEDEDSQERISSQLVVLQAKFSQELLETIFTFGTPLHDGAVIIRGLTIFAAAAILPLANDPNNPLLKSMGTRHRAGMGVSQQTDALVIVISEEHGRVSLLKNGQMTSGVKPDRFRSIVRSTLSAVS